MRRFSQKVGLSIGACALGLKVLGAQAAEVDFLSMSLEELLQTHITGSTLTNESLRSAPSSITVFTRADIQRLGVQYLTQLINLVPGYQASRSDNSSAHQNISSRGRRFGNTGSEILILLDGQRLNYDWAGGALQGQSIFSLENVDRVEFIRGPGSSIYGSNAVMGVINIVTRSEREVVVDAGENGYRHTSVQWNWQGEWGKLAIYGGRQESTGATQSIVDPFSTVAAPVYLDTRDPYLAKDFYVSAESGEFSLNARLERRSMQQFYVVGYVDNSHNDYQASSDNVTLGWQHALNDGLRLEGHVFQSRKTFDLTSAISEQPYLLVDGGIHESEAGTQWLLKGDNGQSHWLLGWEWRHPRLDDTDAHVSTLTIPNLLTLPQAPENGRVINGLFAQYQAPLTTHITMTLGLRRDSYSDVGAHFSPRVGLVDQLGDNDTLKLLYSEAFRAPSRIETSVINSAGFQNNPDLQPETAKTTELVWQHLLRDSYIAATLFHTHVDDAIQEIITPDLKRSWGNRPQALSGVEVEWQKTWLHNWQTRVALTHMFDSTGFVYTESSTLLSGSLSYEKARWTVSFVGDYQSQKCDPNEQDSPANIMTTEYTTFGGRSLYGAHIAYRFLPDMNVYIHADNLFNTHYLSPADRPSNFVGVPGEERVITLGIRWALQ